MMMKTYKLYTLLALLGAMSFFTSCDDDEVVKTPLGTTSISQANSTVSSLSFAWEAVTGATQYAYELRDPDEALVKGDVTTATTASFTGLKDNTTYTLSVWAYAALSSDKTTSPIAVLKATTAKIVPLAAPEPTAEMQNGNIVITWEPVEHASYYTYSLHSLIEGEEKTLYGDEVSESSLTLSLEIGTYRCYVQAISEEEAYTNSDMGMVEFERTKQEEKRIQGTYTGLDGSTGTADLVLYDDGSYTLAAFHGAEGYDLDFAVDAATGAINILNGSSSYGYNYVWTDESHYLAAYTPDGYSLYEGDMKRGEVWFYAYYYDKDGNYISEGYYDMTWGMPEVSTWSAEGTFEAGGTQWNATIEANADGTYTIKKWWGNEGYDLHFSVAEDGSMTLLDVEEDDWYWYAPMDASSYAYLYKPMDGESYANFEGDSNGGSLYVYDYTNGYVTFTWGAAESKPQPWEAAGSFVMEDYEDQPWSATIYYNEDGTYTIKDWYDEGENLDFTVDEEGRVTFINCEEEEYYWYVPMGGDYGYVYKPIDGVSYANFEGDENGGTLVFYEYYSKYITFTWGSATSGAAKKVPAARPAPARR